MWMKRLMGNNVLCKVYHRPICNYRYLQCDDGRKLLSLIYMSKCTGCRGFKLTHLFSSQSVSSDVCNIASVSMLFAMWWNYLYVTCVRTTYVLLVWELLMCYLCENYLYVTCVRTTYVLLVWDLLMCYLCENYLCVTCVRTSYVLLVWELLMGYLCEAYLCDTCVRTT